MRNETGHTHRLEDYRPFPFRIPETNLVFQLDALETVARAALTIEARPDTPAETALELDGDGLDLRSIKLDGVALDANAYTATPDRLIVHNPPRGRFVLQLETKLAPETNKALSGLYRSNGVYCTQCEAEGFRRITYFADRPDVLSVYTVRIEAKKGEAPLLLSNGNPGDSGALGGDRHFAVWHDPWPKPSYLFALVAGDLGSVRDSFITRSGRTVSLAIHVEHGKENRALYAMDALKRSMKWDEEVFGLEYDLDVFNVVAVSDFNLGAMENKGLNIFNDKYVLADADTATDTDYAGIEAVIAHEYFHNWTGNRITCRDWFQLCLKEGLTVFRDHEFSADQRSRAVKRIAEVRALRAHQFPEDAGPLAHRVRPETYREINNFYTSTVYEKGSEVVRMLRTVLGTKAFKEGMALYLNRHDGEAATVEQFIKAFEDASGEDLTQFSLWYHQAGTPSLNISYDYDRQSREFVVSVEQSLAPTPGEPRKRSMHIPVAFALLGHNGNDMDASPASGGEVSGGVMHVRKRRQHFRFKGIAERPIVSILRGFSAPVNVNVVQPRTDLYFLARHDSDLYSRWEALMRLYSDALVAATRELRGRKSVVFETDIARAADEIAGDGRIEEAFRAQALTLPSETDLARELGMNIDPDAVFAARNQMSTWLGKQCAGTFETLYENVSRDTAYSVDAASAGRRALRTVMLDLLAAASGSPAAATRQFNSASNMTDRMGALIVLTQRFGQSQETEAALAQFERLYGGDALILDKWFMAQASIPGESTLARVKALTAHTAYTQDNPNRVRALIGTFASANQTGFNRPDGAAYTFFSETILSIDRANPQLAARLLTAMRSWRSLERTRRENARAALAGIAAERGISTDTREIVERILA